MSKKFEPIKEETENVMDEAVRKFRSKTELMEAYKKKIEYHEKAKKNMELKVVELQEKIKKHDEQMAKFQLRIENLSNRKSKEDRLRDIFLQAKQEGMTLEQLAAKLNINI